MIAVPTMKWTLDSNGQWVRRCFDLTITPTGKSDKPTPPVNTNRKAAA